MFAGTLAVGFVISGVVFLRMYMVAPARAAKSVAAIARSTVSLRMVFFQFALYVGEHVVGRFRAIVLHSFAQLFGPLFFHCCCFCLYCLIILASIFRALKYCDADVYSFIPSIWAISLCEYPSSANRLNTVR